MIPDTMRAGVLYAPRSEAQREDLRIVEVPVPRAGPGEALIRIHSCGVCASDLHVVQGVTPTSQTPMILGHEVAGTVAAYGPQTDGLPVGARVLVPAMQTCGRCAMCMAGRENICAGADILSVTVDGGQAEYIAVPAASLIELPEGLPFPQASLLADAVATPYHALRRSGIRAGQTAVVIGLGGLGMHAVLLAKALEVHVIGVDRDAVSLERACEWGADDVVDATDGDTPAALDRLTGGGADFSFEFVGATSTARLAVRCLRPGGRAMLVGVSRDRLDGGPLGAFVAEEKEVIGSFGQTRQDVTDLLTMWRDGGLDLSRSVSHVLPLEQLPDALHMLETREGAPLRVVIDIR